MLFAQALIDDMLFAQALIDDMLFAQALIDNEGVTWTSGCSNRQKLCSPRCGTQSSSTAVRHRRRDHDRSRPGRILEADLGVAGWCEIPMTQPAPSPSLGTDEQLSGAGPPTPSPTCRASCNAATPDSKSAQAHLAEALLTAQAVSEAGRARLRVRAVGGRRPVRRVGCRPSALHPISLMSRYH